MSRTKRSIEASSIASIAPKVFRQERQKYCWAPTLASPQRSPPLPSADPSNSYTLSILTTNRLHPTSLLNFSIVVTKNNYPQHNTKPLNALQVYTGIKSLLKFGTPLELIDNASHCVSKWLLHSPVHVISEDHILLLSSQRKITTRVGVRRSKQSRSKKIRNEVVSRSALGQRALITQLLVDRIYIG